MINKSKIQKDAQKFLLKGMWDKAISEYNKIISETPNDASTYNTVGDIYLKKNDTDNAIDFYKKAAEIFSRSGFTLKAIALYKKVLNIKPDQVDILLLMGKLNAERGMLGNANESYLAAAAFYTRHGQRGRALEVYKTLCELNPDNHSIASKLAELYMLEDLVKEGVSKYIELAEKMAARGELKEAREFLDKAAQHGSDRYDFLITSAAIDLKEDRLPEATRSLEEARKFDPGDVKVSSLLAETYTRSGRFEESGAVYRDILSRNPSDTACRKQLIEICIKAADYESAWKEYQALADGHLGKGELADAEDLMKEFLAHKPDSIEARQALADIYAKTGRDADVDRLHREMADSYRDSGLMDKAANIYRQLLEKSPDDEELIAAVASVEESLPAPEAEPVQEEALPPAPPSALEQAYTEEPVQEEPAPGPDGMQDFVEDGLFDFAPEAVEPAPPEDSYPSLDLDAEGLDDLDIFIQDSETGTAAFEPDQDVIKILSECSRPAISLPDVPFDEPVAPAEAGAEPEISATEPSSPSVTPPGKSESLADRLSDVDLLIKNGLTPMAREALTDLESEHPSNTAIKARHIEIAKALGDVEGFIEASIGLAELYDSLGMHTEARKLLEKAREMDPKDDRLKPLLGEDAEQHLQRVDRNSVQYMEEVAEADFYVQQGLADEARNIYDRILALDPDNSEIRAKSERLGRPSEPPEQCEPTEALETQEQPELDEPTEPLVQQAEPEMEESPEPSDPALSALEMELDEVFKELDLPEEETSSKEPSEPEEAIQPEMQAAPDPDISLELDEESGPGPVPDTDDDDFFDLGAELREEFDRVDPGETFDDAKIEEVFQEFKKGVEQQLGREDYDTHYNLGIAYKEMGMIEDAINEFVLAGKDQFKAFDCLSMLGLCSLEKGDYESAVEHMKKGLECPGREKGEYMALKYDLAGACERLGDIRSAQSLMKALYEEDAGFRDVKARLEALDRALEGAGLRPADETGDDEGPKPVPKKKSRVSYL